MRRFLHKQWPFLLFLAAAFAVTAWAFSYLIDFRPPDVPFVVTPNDVVEQMLDLAQVTDKDYLVDLGSGDGRVLIAAGKRGVKSMGIEIDPVLAEQSRTAIHNAGLDDHATVIRGDIFREDFSKASVVTMFLKIQLNAQLRPQLDELKPGTRIVSHMWSMPGAKPEKTILARSHESKSNHTLHLWVTPIAWQ